MSALPVLASRAFDADLIRRYDGRSPRYTSYPTAQQFQSDFDTLDYRRAALLSNMQCAPLSIYVHVPFCESPCFYCGCNRVITRDHARGRDYVELLQKEIELQAALFDRRRSVRQIHFGGGTPTFLEVADIHRVLKSLDHHFTLSRPPECSIEIDPRTVDAAKIAALACIGFNRLSLGVQDFDPQVQAAVNRIQSVECVQQTVDAARSAQFKSISFDLIYGLPRQTLAGFSSTLAEVLRMRPDRIAAYGYAHLPQMFKAQRRILDKDLPDAATRLQLLELTVTTLTAAGYEYIGLDHFALPDDELTRALQRGELHRNFQGYSTHAGCDLIGLGVSAIGKVGTAYMQNAKRLPAYAAALRNGSLPIERGLSMNTDDLLRGEIIQRIMCTGSIDRRELEDRYAVSFDKDLAPELEDLEELSRDGLVEVTGDHIAVTPTGRFLLRSIASVFDRYHRSAQQRVGAATI